MNLPGHVLNVIKCSPKNVIIGIMSRIKGSFYKEIALVQVESSDAAKLAAKKAPQIGDFFDHEICDH
ncbi:hypothetical protein BpHYR1_025671 [Brachionus plicatilis]|uniref:Uncharacterized protein n=1 Tax=Brachionus plicatilis TaxID=10195 RepID=A0A3M7P311_BRAPC|nr:hypothetical protein BpHYR1_025671 [Brachionus plicatilis]